MTIEYCKERLLLFDKLFKDGDDVASGRLWTLDLENIRFKLGENHAELKIPYHLGGEDERVIENAVKSLVDLIQKRYDPDKKSEPAAGVDEFASPSASQTAVRTQPLGKKSYKIDVLMPDTLERKVALEVLSTTPFVDGAMLINWLGPEGYGKQFIQWAEDLVKKALTDEKKTESGEKTAYLVLLAMLNTIIKKKEIIKETRIKGVSFEKLDMVVGFTLYVALRTALWELFERLRESGVQFYSYGADVLLKSTLVAKEFLTIQSNLLSTSLNPYGIDSATFEAITRLDLKIDESTKDMDRFLKGAIDKAAKDKALVEVVSNQYKVMKFRRLMIDYLNRYDVGESDLLKLFYKLYPEDRFIESFVKDDAKVEELDDTFVEIKEKYSMDEQRVETAEAFHAFLGSLGKGRGGWFAKSGKQDVRKALGEVITCYCALVLDEHVHKFAGHMRMYLVDRRGTYDNETLIEEYNRGRLYRFSIDKRPILPTLTVDMEGQLFVDMKDFTKKTFKVKEITMAEFMKENFYEPIVDAACKYKVGSGMLADETGIRLNNLPGDAAVFSGGVRNLVALACDIDGFIGEYCEKLKKRLPPVKDELVIEDTHKKFAIKKVELDAKKKQVAAAAVKGDKDAEKKLAIINEEIHRLDNKYRSDLEAVITSEMEAGLFITYGVKAEILTIEEREEFTKPIRVAIGEKINEAARGTSRNSMVRAKLEVFLEKERLNRGIKTLEYPFKVYIDTIYSMRMPPEFDEAITAILAHGKAQDPRAIATMVATECFVDLKKLISGRSLASLRLLTSSSDIYNRGVGITWEALSAYIKEARGTKLFFKKVVVPAELDESITQKYVFPMDELVFVCSHESREGLETVEIFVKIGEVIFKGFESKSPTVVYEMLDQGDDFFRAIKSLYFGGWFEEAKEAKKAKS